MAGTGHSYEIANVQDVDGFLGQYVVRVPEEVAGWFRSRSIRRFLTSEAFTIPVDPIGLRRFLSVEYPLATEFEVARLCEKAERGEARIFESELLGLRGLNFEHLCDWVLDGIQNDSSGRFVRKLMKTTLADAFRKVERWNEALSRTVVVEPVEIRPVMDALDGRRWVELLNGGALQTESVHMHHCVGGEYFRNQIGNGFRFFSLRRPDGWPVLTMQCAVDGEAIWPLQVKGFANSLGHVELAGDLLLLLGSIPSNVVRSFPHAGDLRTFDVMRDYVEGEWVHKNDLFAEIDLDGVTYGVLGKELRVIENGMTLATVSATTERSDFRWKRGEVGFEARVVFNKRDTLDARRRACRVLNHFEFPHHSADTDGLVHDPDGTYAAWEDTNQAVSIAGVPCRLRPGEHYDVPLPKSRVVVLVKPESQRYGTKTVPSVELKSVVGQDDARLLCRILNDLKVEQTSDPDYTQATRKNLVASGIARHAQSPWYLLRDGERTHPSRYDGMVWKSCPWSLRLVQKGNGRVAIDIGLVDSGVCTLGWMDEKYHEEVVRILRRLRIGSAPDRYFPSTENKTSHVVFDGRTWHVVRRVDKLARLVDRSSPTEDLPRDLLRLGLVLFEKVARPLTEVEQRARRRCVFERLINRRTPLWNSSLYFVDHDPMSDLYEISSGIENLSPRQVKALARLIEETLPKLDRRVSFYGEHCLDLFWVLARLSPILTKRSLSKVEKMASRVYVYGSEVVGKIACERRTLGKMRDLRDACRGETDRVRRRLLSRWAGDTLRSLAYLPDVDFMAFSTERLAMFELLCEMAWEEMSGTTSFGLGRYAELLVRVETLAEPRLDRSLGFLRLIVAHHSEMERQHQERQAERNRLFDERVGRARLAA